jgi:polyhydroxybutyrate depolymerase
MFKKLVALLILGVVFAGMSRAQPGTLRDRLKSKLGESKEPATSLKKMTWKVGEETREALVYLPPKLDKDSKPPLIIAYHGHGGTSAYAARKFNFHQHWPEAICVYPQGLNTATPLYDKEGKRPGWQLYVGHYNDRDLDFFDAVMKTMITDHHIDEKRVYATGHSNGAYFTYLLAASRGDKLTAIAPIAGNISIRDFKNQKALPTLHVAGKADPLISFASQERSISQVKKLNGCDEKGKPAGKDCTEYTSTKGAPLITLIHSGGHEVPDGTPERITQFFKEFPKKLPK